MEMLEYLDEVKRCRRLPSDYALAKELGVSKETISQLRRGRMHMSESMALKIAEILDIDPVNVLVSATAARSQVPEAAAVWKSLMEKISTGFEHLISHATPRRTRLPAW